jgi:hypothetical protein
MAHDTHSLLSCRRDRADSAGESNTASGPLFQAFLSSFAAHEKFTVRFGSHVRSRPVNGGAQELPRA